jgi:peroxiredoxin Q/BCP
MYDIRGSGGSEWKGRRLQAGDLAPDVTVAIENGCVRLRDFVGTKRVVLYFYPRDSTPSCTTEARAFNDLIEQFSAAETEVIGVSTDSVATHARFARREGLRFSLGADPDGALAEQFGVANRLVQGIRARRVTFLIDKNGRIARIWDRVNPQTHPLDVLDVVRQMATDA